MHEKIITQQLRCGSAWLSFVYYIAKSCRKNLPLITKIAIRNDEKIECGN
jgi:hypothetical protein